MLFLVGTFALTTAIFWPFLKPLALAAVFAVVLQGLYQRVSKLLGGWPSTAALLTVIVSVFAILLPLSLVGVLVGNEARSLYTSLEAQGGESTIAQMILRVDETFSGVIPGLGEFSHTASVDINTYTKEALQWITGHAGQIFSSISSLLLSLFIFFIARLLFLERASVHVERRRGMHVLRGLFLEVHPEFVPVDLPLQR